MPWYEDLELARHGATYIEPELNVALLTGDGRPLEWWTDIARTIASFREFSPRDADTLQRWHDEFVPIVRDILIAGEPVAAASAGRAAKAPGAQRGGTQAAGGERALAARVRAAGIRASDRPGGAAVLQRAARGRPPRARLRPSHCGARWRAPPRRRCRAAARRRWRARWRPRCGRAAARSACCREPKRIVVEQGRAVGVETESGEVIRRAPLRRVLAQSAPDLPRPARSGSGAARDPRPGRAFRVQSPGAAVRAQPQPARAAASTPPARHGRNWRTPSW